MSERRPATTIGELDVHIGYLQQEVKSVATALSGMATKADIEAITKRMDEMATKAMLNSEVSALRDELTRESPRTKFREITDAITKMGAAATVLVAFAYGVVSILDKVAK